MAKNYTKNWAYACLIVRIITLVNLYVTTFILVARATYILIWTKRYNTDVYLDVKCLLVAIIFAIVIDHIIIGVYSNYINELNLIRNGVTRGSQDMKLSIEGNGKKSMQAININKDGSAAPYEQVDGLDDNDSIANSAI